MTAARVFTCYQCSATAPQDPNHRGCGLPRGWEHRDSKACHECVWTTQRPAAELAAPVCSDCVGVLLDALLVELRRHRHYAAARR